MADARYERQEECSMVIKAGIDGINARAEEIGSRSKRQLRRPSSQMGTTVEIAPSQPSSYFGRGLSPPILRCEAQISKKLRPF